MSNDRATVDGVIEAGITTVYAQNSAPIDEIAYNS